LRGISDDTKRLIALEMYELSADYDPNMVLKDNLYLVDYYSEQEGRSIYLVEDPEQLIPDSIEPVIQFDIDNGVYNNNISFDKYHGKSKDEYLEEIRKELAKLKTRNTYFLENVALILIPSPSGREDYTVSRIK
jgi:hypothetical protein